MSFRTQLILPFLICSLTQASQKMNTVSGENLLTQKNMTISAEGKKGLIVVFLSAKCPCSNSHLVELNSLASTYSDFNFVGVHSNVDEDKSTSMPYFKNANLPFPIINDHSNRLANQFKALKTPHSFLLLPNGSIAFQGGVSNSADFEFSEKKFLRDAIDDLSQNRKIRVSEARTLGCVITRGEMNVW